jgi:hypothetical protein
MRDATVLLSLFFLSGIFVLCRYVVGRLLGFKKDALLPRSGSASLRLTVAFAVPLVGIAVSVCASVATHLWTGTPRETQRSFVSEVTSGSPAAEMGLQRQDEIIRLNGHPTQIGSLPRMIRETHDQPFVMEIVRKGQLQQLTGHAVNGRIGILLDPSTEYVHDIRTNLVAGIRAPFAYWRELAGRGLRTFQGGGRAEFSGPIGIVRVVRAVGVAPGAHSLLLILFSLCFSVSLLSQPVGLLLFALARPRRA